MENYTISEIIQEFGFLELSEERVAEMTDNYVDEIYRNQDPNSVPEE